MADDPSSENGVPDEVSAWLADLADERGLTKQELLERLLAGDGVDAPVEPTPDVAAFEERVAALEDSVSDLEESLDEQVQDVRERVIQVKREADAKAPRDHDHADLQEAVRRVGQNLEALGNDFVDLDADVDRMDERVDEVDDRMSRGFSNYEDVLSYLIDVTDDLNRKVETLARTLMEVREGTRRLETADARRAGADRLRETAGRHGVTEARCEACKESVHLGVLTAPRCPHCEESFAELEPSKRFFRPDVLRTGRRPALDGEVEHAGTDLDAIVSEEVDAPPEVGVDAPAPTAADTGDAASGQEGAVGADGGATSDDEGFESEDGGAEFDDGRPEADDLNLGTDVGPQADDVIEDDAASPSRTRNGAAGAGGAADLAVDEVAGIGSAYADRLAEAGVETVGALALSDPARLAERTDVARGRVDSWIDRARQMVEAD